MKHNRFLKKNVSVDVTIQCCTAVIMSERFKDYSFQAGGIYIYATGANLTSPAIYDTCENNG